MRDFRSWGLRGPAEWRQGFFGIIVVKSPNFSFVASPSLSEHFLNSNDLSFPIRSLGVSHPPHVVRGVKPPTST